MIAGESGTILLAVSLMLVGAFARYIFLASTDGFWLVAR